MELWISLGICLACIFFIVGVHLERERILAEQQRKRIKRTEAFFNQPERICGAWVFNDGKGRGHHCVLDHDHDGDLHRSETGMGRKVAA
jgi:hypothetical protein